MVKNVASTSKAHSLSARRLVLLASVAAVGAVTLFGSPDRSPLPAFPGFAHAAAARSTGFADVAEKVMPAVISVR